LAKCTVKEYETGMSENKGVFQHGLKMEIFCGRVETLWGWRLVARADVFGGVGIELSGGADGGGGLDIVDLIADDLT